MKSSKGILSSKLVVTAAAGVLALLLVCVAFILAPQATLAQPPDRPASAESAHTALAPAAQDVGEDALTDTLCMGDVYDLYGGGGSPNCTANDVNLAQASVDIIEPCDFPGDTATISLTVLVNLTAQERHDIGAYLSIEGGNALTGTCNIYTLPYTSDPPWLDLDDALDEGSFCGGDPYGQPCVSDDQCTAPETCDDVGPGIQDTCGDIDADHNPLILDAGVITVQCLDPDNDGWLDLPTCTSWRQPGANELCTQPLNAFPGAPSKCRCMPIRLDVPVPPALYVDKVTDPSGDTTLFDFEVTGPTADSFSLRDEDPSHLVAQTASGTYAVTETVPAGWELTSATCTDGSPVDAIELSNGEIVTCTFANTLMIGTLEVVKELVPSDDLGLFSLYIDTTEYPDRGHGGTTGEQTVISGTHTVSETAGTGTVITDYDTSYSCTGGSAPSGDGTSFSVDVAAGETVVCTITNSRLPKLEVVKELDPTDDPGRFNLYIDAADYANKGHLDTTGEQTVISGIHTVSETAYTGYSLDDYDSYIECRDEDGQGIVVAQTTGPGPLDVQVAYGDDVVCTITNSRLPKLEVVKELDPTDDPGRFNLYIDATEYANKGHLDTTGEQTVISGTHTVSETAFVGHSLDDYDSYIECRDEDGQGIVVAQSTGPGPVDVRVTYGDDVVCTITNTRLGKIVIDKVTDPPADPRLFYFTLTGGPDALGVPFTLWDLSDPYDTGLVKPGTYWVTETVSVDFNLTSISCEEDVNANSSGDLDDRAATINLEPGEVVTCTFTNVDIPSSIEVTKTADPISVSECGEPVTFTVVVTNTSPVDIVTIDTLTDTIYGDITQVQGDILNTTCSVTKTLGVGEDYTCSFTATVSGKPGKSETNEVTASGTDDDGYAVSDFDDATVTFTEVLPDITVTKTPFPLMRGEPGGEFTFRVLVTNQVCEPVTLTSLVDVVYDPQYTYVDNLDGKGTCKVGQTIEGYGSYDCEFTRTRYWDPVVITDTVTAVAEDDDGHMDTASDDAWIEITGRLDIEVTKTANPTTVAQGDPVSFTVRVTNITEPEDVLTLDRLLDLVDTEYLDLNGQGTCSLPQDLPAKGSFYECTFTVIASGDPGSRIDTVHAHVTDAMGRTGHDTASATVQVIPVLVPEYQVYLPLVIKN